LYQFEKEGFTLFKSQLSRGETCCFFLLINLNKRLLNGIPGRRNRKLFNKAAQDILRVSAGVLVAITVEVCQRVVRWAVGEMVDNSRNELGFASSGWLNTVRSLLWPSLAPERLTDSM
jgi:hypothetical protein